MYQNYYAFFYRIWYTILGYHNTAFVLNSRRISVPNYNLIIRYYIQIIEFESPLRH